MSFSKVFIGLIIGLFPSILLGNTVVQQDLTSHWLGFLCITIFALAYVLVIFEERLHLQKSKPVLMAAGLIWIVIATYYSFNDIDGNIETIVKEGFLEYAELFFFLLVAMTYINAMLERGVFDSLRHFLIEQGFSYRQLFWITGILSFVISPIADNLTTALIMCAVILAVGQNDSKYIGLSCINIVIGANAGGAFSPFGDITTLMVWQKGIIAFDEFFSLFLPALVNYLVPATLMYLTLPHGKPQHQSSYETVLKYGGITISILFLLTIVTAIVCHHYLHLPPVFGMMTGLAYLKLYGFYLRTRSRAWRQRDTASGPRVDDPYDFDVFSRIARAEWDTLFFFYGIILAVGGLGFLGYLSLISNVLYNDMGPTIANILVGIISAIIDNIPVMFAVLSMQPEMSHGQWLLVTLTAGVGGSLLSIGSAAGVALMGQAKGHYTFTTHLRWTPVILLGYGLSIFTHIAINGL